MKPIPDKWLRLFDLLPNYSPVETAHDEMWFDAATAEQVCAFYPRFLTHTEGPLRGKPFHLQPWQQSQIGCAFGWKRENGLRRYREVFDYEPRKNGKTAKVAGLFNLVAFCDGEPGAQLYAAAADRDQSSILYKHTSGMLQANQTLLDRVRIFRSLKSIEYPEGTTFRALSADAHTKHGFNSHFVVVDELHAQPNRDLVDVLVTSMGARLQPLIWYITTADYARESICNEKLDYAHKVQRGAIDDPAFLPCVFEAQPEDDWESPEIWRKANPNLGISVSEEYLARECQRAKDQPTYLNTFKRLHLNMKTTSDVAWFGAGVWDRCGEEFDLRNLEGRECFAGLDLSTTTDISAFVLVFPPDEEGGPVYVVPFFWIPGDRAEERQKRDRVPYQTWVREKRITATEGNVVDYRIIRRDINEIGRRFQIKEIAFDPWNASALVSDLQDDGFEMIQFRQGYPSLTGPSKELEALVLSGRLRHGGNPVLKWMASNVMIESDHAGNIKPSKKKSTERIDGIVALVMALGRMDLRTEEFNVSDMLTFLDGRLM